MRQKPKWVHNRQLLLEAAENFKLLENENEQLRAKLSENAQINKEKEKILKLYNYSSWGQYMQWVQDRLKQSGEDENSEESHIKRVLSEIIQQPDFQESGGECRNDSSKDRSSKENEAELLSIQNGKLRRENITLKNKLVQLRAFYHQKRNMPY